MHRRKDIVAHDPLGNQDRILVIVSVPRHEGDNHVLAERKLAEFGRGTVGNHFALGDAVSDLHQRALVDAGVLVRPLELSQTVDVDAGIARLQFLGGANDDPLRINLVDDARAPRHYRSARIPRHDLLDAGTDERRFRLKERHGLALHVRPHARPVRIVVLKERDQRGRDRHQLLGRDVDLVHLLGRSQAVLAGAPRVHHLVLEPALAVQLGVGLRHNVPHFLGRRHVGDLVRDLAVLDLAVRRLDESVLVHAGKRRKRVDQADVRTFRRLDGAHPAIVGRMNVPHLEARTFAGQAARAERRQASLVRDLGKRIRLVHELRELR